MPYKEVFLLRFDDPELEESWQAKEYEKFFNSEDDELEEYSYSSGDLSEVVYHLEINNKLLGFMSAILLVLIVIRGLGLFSKFINDTIKHI